MMLLKKSTHTWFNIYLLVYQNVIQFWAAADGLTPSAFVLSRSTRALALQRTSAENCNEIFEFFKANERKWNKLGMEIPMQMRQDLSNCLSQASNFKDRLSMDYCLFDCKGLDNYLKAKKGKAWLVPKFFNAFFRGIAQVIIANNPITGLFILVGIFISNITVGFVTSWATTVAIITAWCIGQSSESIREGLTTYNAVLVGSVISTLWTAVYNQPVTLYVWGLVTVGSVLSVYVNSGMGNILEHWGLPTLTLPFNIVTILLFTLFKPAPTSTTTATVASAKSFETTKLLKFEGSVPDGQQVIGYIGLDLWQVIKGIIYSIGQVYAVQTLAGSIVMYLGVIIYSPILFMMSIVGATIGTFTGLLFVTKAPYTSIYTGIWGYNGILAAIAIGCFFLPLNTYSFLSASLDVIFAVFIQQALVLAFTPLNVPVLTFPFVLATYIFLSVTAREGYLKRVTVFTYPEKHLEDYIEYLRLRALNGTLNSGDDSETN